MVGTYFAVAGGELNTKEKVFMAFAWMPKATGKKHALKKYDQFTLNTSCFWGNTGSNITPVV